VTWAPDYITSAQLKNYVKIGDAVDDIEVASAVTAASRAIDDHCNRQFGQLAAAAEFSYPIEYDYDRGVWYAVVDDMTIVPTAVTIGGEAVTGYTLEPRNAVAKGKAYTRITIGTAATVQPSGDPEQLMAVTDVWGWTATPAAVVQASKLQGSRFLARRGSPYGVAGSPSDGSELRLLSRVDPDVAVSLRGYVRPRRVA